ncbi:repeat-containing 87 [Podarcis lilfordi]|uniref:Repeat-containing 87 n=1 Tax=Podarcis lilfordi TaxID=74358 RepID=A0AA35PDJ4_9SAUR|nr:repeat-containing 87 [Podarcis lilfordi]
MAEQQELVPSRLSKANGGWTLWGCPHQETLNHSLPLQINGCPGLWGLIPPYFQGSFLQQLSSRSTTMVKEPVRIVPLWRELQGQLFHKLQMGAQEVTEGSNIMLSDRPTIIFRKSSSPNFMPVICHYSGEAGHYFASFSRKSSKKGKVRVWVYNPEDETPITEREYAIEEDPKVLYISYASHLHLFVAYCDDIHLRLFGDHTQECKMLSEVKSPYSVTSMCYNPETGEVVTGAIGIVAFWGFTPGKVPYLAVTREVQISSGEFVHYLSLEQERKVLVALCENIIRVYDYNTKTQTRAFQVSQGVSLTCCSSYWPQSFLFTGDLAGDIKVWNFDKGTQTTQFKAHQSAITTITTRHSFHTIMTTSLDGLLKEWNLTTCELLRRLDIGEQLFQMQFLNEQTFFLCTLYTFSIRTVNNFCQLFNRTKSMLTKLLRVQCGPNKARILAATEDGVIRFLSPVTGEMLFVTWPFQVLEKALDYVYDPDREELLVTMGTNDIYVLDTTKNPCPVKHILRVTEGLDDRVLCLAYSRLDLEGRTCSFIFSGYKSGKVRTITQNLYRMGNRKLHDGKVVALSSISASGNLSYHSRESSYLCSYGQDQYIILSDVLLKKDNFLEVLPLVVIPSFNCRINNLLLIPGYICALTEHNRVRLWRQASLVPGQKNRFWKETGALHATTITSFDYCHTLSMLVTSGSDGTVRVWDILGQMLVEFDTSLKFSRVCFANQRGDLVVGCNMNIYFIPCVLYLPRDHLYMLMSRCVKDDMIERPLAFLPHFLLTFDIVFVPKYRQVGRLAKKYERLEPISNPKEVVMENNVATVLHFIGKEASALPGPDFYGAAPYIKELQPEFFVKYQLLPQQAAKATPEKKTLPAELPPAPPPSRVLPPLVEPIPVLSRIPFQAGRTWPIAPDGYVPNSVIRAQLFPKGTPKALQCSLDLTRQPLPRRKMVKILLPETDEPEAVDKIRRKKPQRRRPSVAFSGLMRSRDLLSEIVSKPWLRHKPSDNSLPSVTKAILDLMDDVPYSTYLMCTAALVQLAESYPLPDKVQEDAFERLIQDTTHKEVRMRLAAWEALGKMDLLSEQEVVPLARALLDENKKVRDLARSLLDSVAGITDKFVLKKEMQRMADSSLIDLSSFGRDQSAFPRRVRAAGIMAETADEAKVALTEGAQKLMTRVENQLTANLFLMNEIPPKVVRDRRSTISRLRSPSRGTSVDFTTPETLPVGQARWLGIFGKPERRAAPAATPFAPERAGGDKLPRIPQARGKGLTVPIASGIGLEERSPSLSPTPSMATASSSSSSSSFSSTSSGSMWREVRLERRELRAKEKEKDKRLRPKVLPTVPHEAPKVLKVRKKAQPILLQRRDTRTQLYTEMLKHQRDRKDLQAAALPTSELRPDTAVLPPKPSQVGVPTLPPVPTKGSLIDPNQEYSSDKTKWRADLHKLLMLRIGPHIEGRTAAEDLLASARYALAGRTMSWEDIVNLSQSLLTSQEKAAVDEKAWTAYIERLQKPRGRESLSQPSTESLEKVVGVTKKQEEFSSSETEFESESEEEFIRGKGVREHGEAGRKKRKKRGRTAGEQEGKSASDKEVAGKVVAKAVKGKSYESLRGKEREAARTRVREAIKERDREAARERELEAAKAREHEEAKARELEAEAMAREREVARARERELARRREREREAAARKRKRLGKLVDKDREGLEGPELARREALKPILKESERKLVEMTESALAEVRGKAKERMMKELKERALAEAKHLAKEDVKAKALGEARDLALVEAKEQAMLKARKMAMVEEWEKVMAEARRKAQAELEERVMAEAIKIAQAENKEGEEAKERIRELLSSVVLEVDEARVLELAKEMGLVVDEERIQELLKEIALEVDEARVQELAELRREELVEAIAQRLAQEKMLGLSESKLKELIEAKAMEMAQARTRALEGEGEEEEGVGEMAERRKKMVAKRRVIHRGEEGEEWDWEWEELEKKEEGDEMWEELVEKTFEFLNDEEREALIALWEEEATPKLEDDQLELSEHAQLFLDILTQPEKLESSDAATYKRLFQVVSMLEVSSGVEAEALAGALLQKAQQILQKGEEMKGLLSKGHSALLQQLKEAVEAYQIWSTDSQELSAKMETLQKTALTVLQARNLKVKLQKEARKRSLWESVKKEWTEEKGKFIKKSFLNKRLKEAIKKLKAEEEKAEQGRIEQLRMERRLKFRSRPIVLGEVEKEKDMERPEGERKEADEEEKQKRGELGRSSSKITWSLAGKEKAWKAIMQTEGLPMAAAIIRPKKYRLPQDSLYRRGQPKARFRRWSLTRGPLKHAFRLYEDKGVDWERFMKLYQSLMVLKEQKGGIESLAWQEQTTKLLDLYGLTNPLIHAMTQHLLLGDRRERTYVKGSALRMRKAQAGLGARILYEMIHHSVRLPPRLPTWHGIIPLSYQNNVHTFKVRGITRYGTLSLKWKTTVARGKASKLRLYVHSGSQSK